MRIKKLIPLNNWAIAVESDDGRKGIFDVSPFLIYDAFSELRCGDEFKQIKNGEYFIEWKCAADLSADTIEALWQEQTT